MLLVCSDCVPPKTPARAWNATRTTLFIGCCSVSGTPAVWQCILRSRLWSCFGGDRADLESARPRLSNVIAADAHRVPLRQVLRAIFDRVHDELDTRTGRENIFVLGVEL